MSDNRFIGWAAFAIFILAVAILSLSIFFPTIGVFNFISPEAALWVVGALALVSTVLGFFAFKLSQGKVAAIGGLLLLAAIAFVVPVSVETSSLLVASHFYL